MVLEPSTVELWLRMCFKEGDFSDEQRMLQYMDEEQRVSCTSYDGKLCSVVRWLEREILQGSWLRMIGLLWEDN
jgi:hypothetical protein